MAQRRALALTAGITAAGTLVVAAVAALGDPLATAPAHPGAAAAAAAAAATIPDAPTAAPTGSPTRSPGSPDTPASLAVSVSAPPTPSKVPWQVAVAGQDKKAAAAKITTAAGHAPVRVVSLRTVDGRPKIVTKTVTGAAAARLARRAAADPAVLALDVDTRSSALATGGDPYRSTQWALDTLAAETVVNRHDAAGVTVAVVDSGVQASHPDWPASS